MAVVHEGHCALNIVKLSTQFCMQWEGPTPPSVWAPAGSPLSSSSPSTLRASVESAESMKLYSSLMLLTTLSCRQESV
jgi:hypothetical protein